MIDLLFKQNTLTIVCDLFTVFVCACFCKFVIVRGWILCSKLLLYVVVEYSGLG